MRVRIPKAGTLWGEALVQPVSGGLGPQSS